MNDLEQMIPRLQALFQPVKNYKPGADKNLVSQACYELALVELARFLRRAGAGNHVAERLEELAAAILGLRHGAVAELLRPSEVGGRGPDGLSVWLLRDDVILGLNCLMKSGRMKTLKQAASHIAAKYRELNRLKRNPDDDLAGAIMNWRTLIRTGEAPRSEEMRAFQQKYFENLGALSPEAMFEHGNEVLTQTERRTAAASL